MAILSMFSGGGSATSVPLEAPTNFLAEARNNKIALTWTDPPNETTTPGGITVATWKYTRIVRKTGSYPTSPNDGVLVVESSVRDQYKTTPFEDGNLENGTLYYYAAYAYNDNNVASDAATIAAAPTAGDVFGVQWDMSNSSTALLRLTPDNDPNHYVNHLIDTEPSVDTASSAGSSPFDEFYPWKGMEEYNVVSGEVKYKQGDSEFSRSSYDTMVWIPEFYYHIEQEGDIVRYYIASSPRDRFEKHPGSGVFLARYEADNTMSSKSRKKPYGSKSLDDARTMAESKGNGWRLEDYAIWCSVNLLYLVEFADFNSQSKIGSGFDDVTSETLNNTGSTDDRSYCTSYYKDAVQYRHLENLWGNSTQYIDGINFNGSTVWVCTSPSLYASNTSEGYTNVGTLPLKNGYINRMDVSQIAPWAMFPTSVVGSSTTYVPDSYYYNSGWGGLWSSSYSNGGPYIGLWYFRCSQLTANLMGGFRIAFDKPAEWEPEVA